MSCSYVLVAILTLLRTRLWHLRLWHLALALLALALATAHTHFLGRFVHRLNSNILELAIRKASCFKYIFVVGACFHLSRALIYPCDRDYWWFLNFANIKRFEDIMVAAIPLPGYRRPPTLGDLVILPLWSLSSSSWRSLVLA